MPPDLLHKFQSTLPVWGGTAGVAYRAVGNVDFNPPSPCGEGLYKLMYNKDTVKISIHPPRVGRDWFNFCSTIHFCVFQSTLPVWGGTVKIGQHPVGVGISIHPPRVGRDGMEEMVDEPQGISIHPPRVGRDFGPRAYIFASQQFQSTLPVWGGTSALKYHSLAPIFQSTLPVWGGTTFCLVYWLHICEFQSTLPVWGGTHIGPSLCV